ncbi:hybrid sensor histidine kinase/response regulator [Mucilaginibacter sp. L196]|uniref:ATP-binding response regulator n=1 Tax=Mucilaginibacter sp. L196 TaxID=1641870 RepID=UPI00131E8324|nr:hybrid sensor histidine kinase/response regulator [Mucilaginibacter sp. L196]
MKVTYTRPLARKILIALLTFIIILSVVAIFVRSSITSKLDVITKLTNTVNSDQSQPEKALVILHKADNDFQESLISSDTSLKAEYKTELSLAFGKIDTILKTQTDTDNLNLHQRGKIKYWYGEKLALSNRLLLLRHGFDSLLTTYSGFSVPTVVNTHVLSNNFKKDKKDVKVSSDTVKKAIQKKGLLVRLKEAISNKQANPQGIIEINHYRNSKETSLTTRKIVKQKIIAYNKQLQQLQLQNIKLLGAQRQLIILNTSIINALDGIINELKEINYKMADDFKSTAIKSYQESTSLLNTLYLVALFLVLMFAALLIVFIVQLGNSELGLRNEIERSVSMAEQKMELLHHMSHEIRNPLTAISGFLYIFSKQNMSPKQVDMLESIKLSSDMMLRTLTDTLDAAKMESSELKINSEPFNPDYTLKKVVESMMFSAIRKKLSLEYVFTGDKDMVLMGDSFRLKQIVINLVSNAIKYTSEGSITVKAYGKDDGLRVEVIDTGHGISQEQQANLFSKYYQTNSAKGQLGTGLGLFICKQLVKLQGGRINVKSNPGAGAIFTFFIPYPKAASGTVIKKDKNQTTSLVNGKSILAIDDNPLNLLFLKRITEKWNIIFHQAANGTEALDIISKNEISVVLTDLQILEMDGQILLDKVKPLNGSSNRIPVIVISGANMTADKESMLKMGFDGIISKPFNEKDLLNQVTAVLNLD